MPMVWVNLFGEYNHFEELAVANEKCVQNNFKQQSHNLRFHLQIQNVQLDRMCGALSLYKVNRLLYRAFIQNTSGSAVGVCVLLRDTTTTFRWPDGLLLPIKNVFKVNISYFSLNPSFEVHQNVFQRCDQQFILQLSYCWKVIAGRGAALERSCTNQHNVPLSPPGSGLWPFSQGRESLALLDVSNVINNMSVQIESGHLLKTDR